MFFKYIYCLVGLDINQLSCLEKSFYFFYSCMSIFSFVVAVRIWMKWLCINIRRDKINFWKGHMQIQLDVPFKLKILNQLDDHITRPRHNWIITKRIVGNYSSSQQRINQQTLEENEVLYHWQRVVDDCLTRMHFFLECVYVNK